VLNLTRLELTKSRRGRKQTNFQPAATSPQLQYETSR
jgi:hypothetical protein